MSAIDHLVVAAVDLAGGARWIEERLGVALDAGGRHEVFGTHNRVLSLGPERYLEVIAVDPEAPPPARPPAMVRARHRGHARTARPWSRVGALGGARPVARRGA